MVSSMIIVRFLAIFLGRDTTFRWVDVLVSLGRRLERYFPDSTDWRNVLRSNLDTFWFGCTSGVWMKAMGQMVTLGVRM